MPANSIIATFRVNTLSKLAIYLAKRSGYLSRSCIAHYLRFNHGYWQVHCVGRARFTKEAKTAFARLYPSILLEFWRYSLCRLMPLTKEIDDVQPLYARITSLNQKSLERFPEIMEHVDLVTAKSNFHKSLIQTDFTAINNIDLSSILYQHIIDTEAVGDTAVILGRLRLHTVNFMDDWNQTVISEAIVRELDCYSIKAFHTNY